MNDTTTNVVYKRKIATTKVMAIVKKSSLSAEDDWAAMTGSMSLDEPEYGSEVGLLSSWLNQK